MRGISCATRNVLRRLSPRAHVAACFDSIAQFGNTQVPRTMQQIQPAAGFQGQLIDRSRGRPGLGAPSSRELMEKVPTWTEFIESVTDWERVDSPDNYPR